MGSLAVGVALTQYTSHHFLKPILRYVSRVSFLSTVGFVFENVLLSFSCVDL